jgi:hypothetical protein
MTDRVENDRMNCRDWPPAPTAASSSKRRRMLWGSTPPRSADDGDGFAVVVGGLAMIAAGFADHAEAVVAVMDIGEAREQVVGGLFGGGAGRCAMPDRAVSRGGSAGSAGGGVRLGFEPVDELLEDGFERGIVVVGVVALHQPALHSDVGVFHMGNAPVPAPEPI